MILIELGVKILWHHCHFKLYESDGANLSSEKKIRVLNGLLCASRIGYSEGKKTKINHSSYIEHHF